MGKVLDISRGQINLLSEVSRALVALHFLHLLLFSSPHFQSPSELPPLSGRIPISLTGSISQKSKAQSHDLPLRLLQASSLLQPGLGRGDTGVSYRMEVGVLGYRLGRSASGTHERALTSQAGSLQQGF